SARTQPIWERIMLKLPRRKFLHLAAGAAVLPAVPRLARAQAYPSKPITVVVGAAAGGPTDTIGRIITERMRGTIGQTLVIKDNGENGTQGTSGAGSPGHIGGVLLQSILNTRWVFVPYRGANPVMQALLGGEFDWTFTTPDQGLPQIRAGRVKAYAVTAKSR